METASVEIRKKGFNGNGSGVCQVAIFPPFYMYISSIPPFLRWLAKFDFLLADKDLTTASNYTFFI
jgi:hypothetical protein